MNLTGMIDRTGTYLQSAPIPVRMAGFESTTTALQSNGWQMSVEHFALWERATTRMRVAFKHDGIKQVAMGTMDLDAAWVMHAAKDERHFFNWFKEVGVEINYIAPMIQVLQIPWSGSIGTWDAIDARPQMKEIKNLTDFAVFKPIKTENFEIYINQKDENEILELLLKKQDAKQAEIRKNQKRRDYMSSNDGMIVDSDFLEDKINRDVRHQIVLVGAA